MSIAIHKETQREAIVNRPHNLAGAIKGSKRTRYCITPNEVIYRDSLITPALLKLFQEALDNPIDVGIKSDKQIKIDIKVTNRYIQIKDDGYGIPSIEHNGHYQAWDAFCDYNTSSNYKEAKGQGQKGVNGIGVKLCTTLSTKMLVDSDDGKKKILIEATDNNLHHKIEVAKSTGSGVQVKFYPDFKIFDVDEINEEHIQRMYEYTLIQALTYPELQFRFNGKIIRLTPKKFMSLFPGSVIDEQEDYFIAVTANSEDDFKQISYVNGLETHLGGTHIDYIIDTVSNNIRTKLQKKKDFKTIKPGDIKNKLLVVVIAKNMKNVDWDGQTKASISSPYAQMRDYFDKTDFDKFSQKVLKNENIMLPITELFSLRAKAKENAELKKLKKTRKKIKSEKYLAATKNKKVLFLCEGASAVGGLMPSLGRENYGYFELRGVPLNAHEASQAKFTNNKELSELFQVIQNEDYDYVCTATDADADGSHIKGLLLGFVDRYLPDLLTENRFGELQTPVQIAMKNKKPQRWTYELGTNFPLKAGETGKYMKGLGSYRSELMKQIVKKDGIDKMIKLFNVDSPSILKDWLSGETVEIRKGYLKLNDFDITGI